MNDFLKLAKAITELNLMQHKIENHLLNKNFTPKGKDITIQINQMQKSTLDIETIIKNDIERITGGR